MNKKKNQASYFGVGNYLKKEKNKQESGKLMETLKQLYVEDVHSPRLLLWNAYDQVRNILQHYLDKFKRELKHTIFSREGTTTTTLDDIEKNMKITRFLDYVLMDSVRHYYQLLDVVQEYFEMGLDSDFVLSPNYQPYVEGILGNKVPAAFKVKKLGYPTQLNLNAWIQDFIERMIFIQSWYEREAYQNPLIVYDLSKIYNPGLFILAILQDYARQTHTSFESVKFDIMLVNVDQTKAPDRGIYIKGLKLIGANWDYSKGFLIDNLPHESVNPVPCIWIQPHVKLNNNDFDGVDISNTSSQFQRYPCPVYSFLIKKGFNDEYSYPELLITTLELSVDNSVNYWAEKNVCMVCEYVDEEEEFNILSLVENEENQFALSESK